MNKATAQKLLIISNEKIDLEEVYHAVINNYRIEISNESSFVQRIKNGRQKLLQLLDEGKTVYGVNTGYGDSCTTEIPRNLSKTLPLYLSRYHQVGLGQNFDLLTTKVIQVVRILSLAQGFSGVRYELLEYMAKCYNQGIHPRIPQEGSVGASGDLTPLAYYAATLQGEGQVLTNEGICETKDVLEQKEIAPIQLSEKEGLALMNGTAVMTAVSIVSLMRIKKYIPLMSRITSMSVLSLLGNKQHYHPGLFIAKPHPGSIEFARQVRQDLLAYDNEATLNRLQDRYSLRCAPHVVGVLIDCINQFCETVNIELNSANDNPLFVLESEEALHGGNFYGGHIANVADTLKVQVANICDLMDRQLALLVDTKFNNGLPANLSFPSKDHEVNHGLKALQISVSAWCAEALKNTMPASVFSRSTECHNQDKVSMGTIASRDLVRNIDLAEQVLSAVLLATYQAISIRLSRNELRTSDLGEEVTKTMNKLASDVDLVTTDRPLEFDLRKILDRFSSSGMSYV